MTATTLQLVSSRICAVEAVRAARRAGGEPAVALAIRLLRSLVLVSVTHAVVTRAASLEPPELRTLDAIHLATAMEANATELLAYDRRLADAAVALGLTVHSPGA
jgi:uncharacterized protein